jgi:hypothetical protein
LLGQPILAVVSGDRSCSIVHLCNRCGDEIGKERHVTRPMAIQTIDIHEFKAGKIVRTVDSSFGLP